MSHTLLVWERNPEGIDVYLIPDDVAKKYRHFLDEAHGRLIGSDEDNDGMKFLNQALSVEVWEDGFEQYKGVLVNYKVKFGSPIVGAHITAVYSCGFMM